MLEAELPLQSIDLRSRPLPVSRRLRELRTVLVHISVPLLVPCAILGLWALAAHNAWVAPQILPAPEVVAATLLEQLRSGELLGHVLISLGRVAGGFVLGGMIGLALGAAMGLSRRVEHYLSPLFTAFSQVPVLGWVPLAMMLLGIGESLKVVLIALAALVPVTINTLHGIRAVPRAYVELAETLRFSRRQLLFRVVLPGAVPATFVGLRYGLSQAWLSLVTVELLASSEGLGFLLVWGRQLFQLDLVLSAIVVVGLIGLALDQGIARIEARLLRWQPTAAAAAGRRA